MSNLETKLIAPSESLIQNHKVLLLDVRTAAEFNSAHIPGSTLKSLGNLDKSTVEQLLKDKDSVVIICQSGNRARQAAGKLCNLQNCTVSVLDGGVNNWQKLGLPLNYGKKTISLERQVRIAAGALVLMGCLLALLINSAWIALSMFVGTGLIFAGITDTCGMAMILARMPWNNQKASSCCSAASCQK